MNYNEGWPFIVITLPCKSIVWTRDVGTYMYVVAHTIKNRKYRGTVLEIVLTEAL